MARIKTATRTVSNRGQRRTLVNVATSKAVGELPTESLVEYDGLVELVADHNIVSLQVQPETVEFEVDGKLVRYTPDVRFVRLDGRIGYREFKDSSKPLRPEVAAKLKAAAAYFACEGYEFSVRTSGEIRGSHLLANLKLLRRYSAWRASEAFQQAVLSFVGNREDLQLHDLRMHIGPSAYGALYRMLWDRRLAADLASAPLSGSTAVKRGAA